MTRSTALARSVWLMLMSPASVPKIARSRLTQGGVMCQWLPLYELSVDDLKSIMATFRGNFKYSTLWQTSSDALLIGSWCTLRVRTHVRNRTR